MFRAAKVMSSSACGTTDVEINPLPEHPLPTRSAGRFPQRPGQGERTHYLPSQRGSSSRAAFVRLPNGDNDS